MECWTELGFANGMAPQADRDQVVEVVGGNERVAKEPAWRQVVDMERGGRLVEPAVLAGIPISPSRSPGLLRPIGAVMWPSSAAVVPMLLWVEAAMFAEALIAAKPAASSVLTGCTIGHLEGPPAVLADPNRARSARGGVGDAFLCGTDRRSMLGRVRFGDALVVLGVARMAAVLSCASTAASVQPLTASYARFALLLTRAVRAGARAVEAPARRDKVLAKHRKGNSAAFTRSLNGRSHLTPVYGGCP